MHNFIWHENFTWRARCHSASQKIWIRLLRFHLSNGLISMTGNLVLMRTFTGWLGLRAVISNLLSVSICCVANFLASDRWVFTEARTLDRGCRSVLYQQQRALRKGGIQKDGGCRQR